MSILNMSYTGSASGGSAGSCYPDIFSGFIDTLEVSKILVLIDNEGKACLVDTQDVAPGTISVDENGIIQENKTDPKPASFFGTNTSLKNARSGPRVAFTNDFASCWVVVPITHLEAGEGSRGMLQVDYYSHVVDDTNTAPLAHTTLSADSSTTLFWAHAGVYSLYLGSSWPFFYDDTKTYITNIQYPSTAVIENEKIFGKGRAYTKGVCADQYEFKAPKLGNSPSCYYDLKPDYSGSFKTGNVVTVNGSTTEEIVSTIEAGSSLQSYDYKTASISSGLQGEDTHIAFNCAISKGHDRAYSIVHPINMHIDAKNLFNDMLEVNSKTGFQNCAFFLGSSKGSSYYKQFFRVYPVLKNTSNRIVEYDPVGYALSADLVPIGATGPHALFMDVQTHYVGPSIRVEYPFSMSDKSSLADSVMYDNTDFAIRMMRYGYTYSCTERDWFVVSSHKRGTLVIQIPPAGDDITHIEGRDIEPCSSGRVIGYSHNNRTPEEYFYIDAFTFVKHKFNYESQVGNKGTPTLSTARANTNAFITPSSENSICSVMYGAIDILIKPQNLVAPANVAYTYTPPVPGSTESGKYVFTEYTPASGIRVHCGLNMNLLSTKFIRDLYSTLQTHSYTVPMWGGVYKFNTGTMYLSGISQLTYTTPTVFNDRRIDQTIGSYHDTVVCVGEESKSTIHEEYHNSHIIIGLNSQRGVLDAVFDSFATLNMPYICKQQNSSKVDKISYKYYSVIALMNNQRHYKSNRCVAFFSESHSELFWMGTSMQYRYRYTSMPTHTNYQSSDFNTCTARMDYAGPNYGLGTYSVNSTNTGRLTLLRTYAQAGNNNTCELAYLETLIEVDFSDVEFTNLPSLLNMTAESHPFPFGAATATPIVYIVTGQTNQGDSVRCNVEVVVKSLKVSSKSVNKVGSVYVDEAMFPKVHFYKDHVFSYTKDKVFAFNPSKGEAPSLSSKKVTACKFVANGWGTHRYIDRFDKFIEDGLGDYIIQLGG